MIQKKKTNKENINAVNVNSKARNWALESKLGPPPAPMCDAPHFSEQYSIAS